MGEFKAAEKSIKKAIKLAKKSHWDVTALKQQLQHIQSRDKTFVLMI